jgi:predicted transposase/invertase (TIGR01784 family)
MILSKFLNPRNDVAFRKIFGTTKNKDILIHFLNDMLTFKQGKPITEVTFLKTIQDPEIAAKKTSIVDILCSDQLGNQYVVEMQVAKEKGFTKRAQYYAAKTYISQMNVKGKYYNLKEVIFLAISDFIMFPDKKAYKSDHVILDRDTGENDLKDFSFTFLELPKFTKGIGELDNMTDKWAYYFNHAEETSEDDLARIIGSDHIMQRAYRELDRFSWNEAELLTYDQTEKYEGAFIASMDQKFDEGLERGEQIGIAKGEQIGIAKGEQIGIAKGEHRLLEEKKRMIRLMLEKGMSFEIICELTNQSISEVKALVYS